MRAGRRGRRHGLAGPAGFTLVEILVVLAIIGLLMGIVGTVAMRYLGSGRVTECEARIQQISLLARSYFDRVGEYPPSRLARVGASDGSALCEGVEALVVALRSASYGGQRPNERWLANVDDDHSKTVRLLDGSSALLELVDPWDHPFVYIANPDYGHEYTYRMDEEEDAAVRAAIHVLTGSYHQFEAFQILSAGPDGILGTADDLANYELQTEG